MFKKVVNLSSLSWLALWKKENKSVDILPRRIHNQYIISFSNVEEWTNKPSTPQPARFSNQAGLSHIVPRALQLISSRRDRPVSATLTSWGGYEASAQPPPLHGAHIRPGLLWRWPCSEAKTWSTSQPASSSTWEPTSPKRSTTTTSAFPAWWTSS